MWKRIEIMFFPHINNLSSHYSQNSSNISLKCRIIHSIKNSIQLSKKFVNDVNQCSTLLVYLWVILCFCTSFSWQIKTYNSFPWQSVDPCSCQVWHCCKVGMLQQCFLNGPWVRKGRDIFSLNVACLCLFACWMLKK